MQNNKKYKIFLSAAEASGDTHCAGLINSLKQSGLNIEFVGVGGEKMKQAGCTLLEETTGHAAMIYNAFAKIGHFYKLIKRIRDYLQSAKPDLVIVCDSPAFNFHVAKAAKKAGIKTLFYVAPQLWAWAEWRIKKMRKCCDKLCCILPFEEKWFSQRGIDTTFVGNPLFDDAPSEPETNKKTYTSFNAENARIAIMPGSRAAEINTLWLPMQQIALKLRERYSGISFVTVAVDEERKQILKSAQISGFDCEYRISSVSQTAGDCGFSIVTSGSATLQVAAGGSPMVIMYQSNKYLWHLVGRWLVKTRYLSLVNILAGKELVPEFMPYFSSVEPIAKAIENLLENKGKLRQVSSDLIDLIKPFADKNAGENTAKIIVKMLRD